jgi:hypothetical protein
MLNVPPPPDVESKVSDWDTVILARQCVFAEFEESPVAMKLKEPTSVPELFPGSVEMSQMFDWFAAP